MEERGSYLNSVGEQDNQVPIGLGGLVMKNVIIDFVDAPLDKVNYLPLNDYSRIEQLEYNYEIISEPYTENIYPNEPEINQRMKENSIDDYLFKIYPVQNNRENEKNIKKYFQREYINKEYPVSGYEQGYSKQQKITINAEEILAKTALFELGASLEARKLAEETRLRERAAHTYRSQKLRLGELGEITRTFLQDRPDIKAGVSAMVRRAKDMFAKTQQGAEMHRAYTPLVAGLLSEPEARTEFMGALDKAAWAQSEELKQEALEKGAVEADIVIVGGGVQGAIFAARARAENPDLRIITIDSQTRLGGQFRSYGDRPVFSINSRNHRGQNNSERALPGEAGNLNGFGDKAMIQLPDITSETYPSNIELGTVSAINSFVSSDSMLGVTLKSGMELDDNRVELTVGDKDRAYILRAKKVVVASGLGDRPTFKDKERENVWTAEDLFRHFGDENNAFPMDEFVGKRIAIIGGGDTGRVAAEIFARLAPREAYGKSNAQLGSPSAILWYGADFEDKQSFQEVNRPRYQRLAPFITNTAGGTYDTGQTKIFATTDKVSDITITKGGQPLIRPIYSGGQNLPTDADIVIDCTPLRSEIFDPFLAIDTPLKEVAGYTPELGSSTPIARQLGKNIFFLGPVAQLPLTPVEKRSFAKGITENTVAIWANQIRTNAIAQAVVKGLATEKASNN